MRRDNLKSLFFDWKWVWTGVLEEKFYIFIDILSQIVYIIIDILSILSINTLTSSVWLRKSVWIPTDGERGLYEN